MTQETPNCMFMWFDGRVRGYCMCMQAKGHKGPHFAVHGGEKLIPPKGAQVYRNQPGGGSSDGRGHPCIGTYGVDIAEPAPLKE